MNLNTLVSIQPKPSVFDFKTITDFLQSYYHYRKSSDANFSYELWAAEFKIKSKSSLRSMCFGKRLISLKYINELATKEKMSLREKRYLICLSELNNLKNEELKDVFMNELLSISDQRIKKISLENVNDFVDFPQLYLIHILIAFEDFHGSLTNISNFTGLTLENTQKTLDRLGELNLVEIIESPLEKIWKAKSKFFSIKSGIDKAVARKFHQNSFKELKTILEQEILDKKIKSLFFSLNEGDFSLLTNEIDDFLNKLKNKFSTDFIESKKIYRFNIHAYPLTKTYKNKCN